jgi:hypothetical protein
VVPHQTFGPRSAASRVVGRQPTGTPPTNTSRGGRRCVFSQRHRVTALIPYRSCTPLGQTQAEPEVRARFLPRGLLFVGMEFIVGIAMQPSEKICIAWKG